MTLSRLASSLGLALLLASAGTLLAQEEKVKDAAEKTETPSEAKAKPTLEKVTLGGGCFWCMEAVFERFDGVKNVVSGYSGGTVPRPTYEDVCTGETGHAEVVQITFDPEVISFAKILKVFFAAHDPTTLNRQGPDFGTQYRSVIFYGNEEQKATAQKVYDELTASKHFNSPIVTELVPFKAFYAADSHHQNYYRKNKSAAYCQAQIVPKLKKLGLLK